MQREPGFRLGSLALPVYLPSLLFATGEGAILPVVPVAANRLGASLALSGFVAALIAVGQLLGDLPSGSVVSRFGERSAMLGSALAALVGLVLCLVAPSVPLLAVGVLIIGVATASFALARQAFMTTFVPRSHRARALSLLGGMFRAGYFVGPFLAAGAIAVAGSTRVAFWLDAAACLAVAVVLLALPDPAAVLAARARGGDAAGARPAAAPQADEVLEAGAPAREGLFRTIRRHRAVLARMGLAAALISGLRSTRQVLLPLAGLSLAIPEGSIALVIGLAGAVDFALFFTSGQVMDRFGRLASALPSMVGLGGGLILLAVTHPLPGAQAWFVLVALVLAVANGIGSGVLMTFGADLAPRTDPAPFLGAYRLAGDSGSAAGPVAVATLTALISLPAASAVLGVVGLVGAGLLVRWVPRYIPGVRGRNA